MNYDIKMDARLASVMGALIADSAALGLHWLYDAERIKQIEQVKGLVFLKPDAAHYADVKGYFAHSRKLSGEASAYGELCLLMLQHFATQGQFNRVAYQTEYKNYFGPGGSYIGYVDSPTRKVLQVLLLLNADDFPEVSGVDDDQFAALASLPTVVITHNGTAEELKKKVTQVIRLTHHNEIAVAAGLYASQVLFEVLQGESIAQALTAALPLAGEKLRPLIEEALDTPTLDSVGMAARFGPACHVQEGLPIIAHIAKHAVDYRTAIEENIRIGGDSCGRSIMLGAIVAAHAAQKNEAGVIPLGWLAKYRKLDLAAEALEQL